MKMKDNKEQNLIKKTAKELGMTYKELGEAIGYSEDAIKKSAISEVSKPMFKAIELLMKNREIQSELDSIKQLQNLLRRFVK